MNDAELLALHRTLSAVNEFWHLAVARWE